MALFGGHKFDNSRVMAISPKRFQEYWLTRMDVGSPTSMARTSKDPEPRPLEAPCQALQAFKA